MTQNLTFLILGLGNGAILAAFGLSLAVFYRSSAGRVMQALCQSERGAALVGINVRAFHGVMWGVGAALEAALEDLVGTPLGEHAALESDEVEAGVDGRLLDDRTLRAVRQARGGPEHDEQHNGGSHGLATPG